MYKYIYIYIYIYITSFFSSFHGGVLEFAANKALSYKCMRPSATSV